MFLSFTVLNYFSVFQTIWFLGILGPSYCGIGATIRIGREILCLPYAGFLPWPLPERQPMVLWLPIRDVTDSPSKWTEKNRHVCNWSRVVDYVMTVSWLSHHCLMTISSLSHDCLMTVSWLSHDFPMTFSWVSHYCLMTVSWLSHDCLMTQKELFRIW